MSVESQKAEDLTERLFAATIGTLEIFSIYLGVRLGLYDVMSESGPMTTADLAGRAGISERYAREWLEQQAVAGFVNVEGAELPAEQRRYTLPSEHAAVLSDPESPVHLAPFALMLVGIGGVLPEVVEAYRNGSGLAFSRYGTDMRDGQGAINRPAFLTDLAESWLPAVPDVHERLHDDPPARVADVGTGQGWAAIGLAAAYPKVLVDGFDPDEASISDARRHAKKRGLTDRARFFAEDAAVMADRGPYDLVLVLEALHDMSQPIEVLAAIRASIVEGGSVVVADEKVAERFAAPGDELERMMYGWSVLHCLPAGLADQPSAGTGTVMRPETLQGYARSAGFAEFEVLPIENDLFRFYRLRG
jgi:2-polyprenyl-3-methyl-5-hydroxy-6-metoxy-1,4-benzoquinol methylase